MLSCLNCPGFGVNLLGNLKAVAFRVDLSPHGLPRLDKGSFSCRAAFGKIISPYDAWQKFNFSVKPI